MRHLSRLYIFMGLIAALMLASCVSANNAAEPIATETAVPAISIPPTSQPTATPTLPSSEPNNAPINPLTGQPVQDPTLLDWPALLISISHFPATARPQAGLSFAPYVFEIYITEGATRFLAAFYGEFPAPEVPLTGNCEVRREPFVKTATILGNQVWLDKNANGLQDIGERGVGGVCVNLYDASGDPVQQTTTDTNGYYGFNVEAGKYIVEFAKPPVFEFTQKNAGDENRDSDVDQATGRFDADVSSDDLSRDAGLIPSVDMLTPQADLPHAWVGPIRSGRLIYADIAEFFQDSCLIYAFASAEVLAQLPKCSFVAHEIDGGGYMMELDRMRAIAEDNYHKRGLNFNYASNTYSDEPLPGGVPASRLDYYVAYLNQSAWVYDPLYQGWLRYVDEAEEDKAGILHAETDRLTGRQLHVENLIVLFTEHDVVSPTNLDIHLEQGMTEDALLFRDGQMYKIKWSTTSGEYERKAGLRRPIQFLDLTGNPMPLKPGHTWILVVTPYSTIEEKSPGMWRVLFAYPEGSK